MLFMFEFRGARMLISEKFPKTTGSIVFVHVDSDVVLLDGRLPLETEWIYHPTPKPSNFEDKRANNNGSNANKSRFYNGGGGGGGNNYNTSSSSSNPAPNTRTFSPKATAGKKQKEDGSGNKDLHMYVCSSSISLVLGLFGGAGHVYGANLDHQQQMHGGGGANGKDARVVVSPATKGID